MEKSSDLQLDFETVIPSLAMVEHVRYHIKTKDLFMPCIVIEKSILFASYTKILDRYLTGIIGTYLQKTAFLAERLTATVTADNCHVFAAILTQCIRHLRYSHVLFHGCLRLVTIYNANGVPQGYRCVSICI